MTDRTCSFPGCDRSSRASGLCRSHYQQKSRGRDLGPLRQPTVQCRVIGCKDPHQALGYCNRHYVQCKNVPRIAKTLRFCSIGGCERTAYVNGMCTKHFQRFKQHGDPHKVLVRMGSGDDVGNSAVHGRVKALRGPARDHECVDCGRQAAHWSYDHADPNEKQSPDGPYSTNTDHYHARCVPCHKRFDLGYIAAGIQPNVVSH